MLKDAFLKLGAMERAADLLRFTRSLNLQGYGQVDRDLAKAADGLAAAIEARESAGMVVALDGLAAAYRAGQEETGLSGFGRVAAQAEAVALFFAAFAAGKGRDDRRA
jgi:hypothetical protein